MGYYREGREGHHQYSGHLWQQPRQPILTNAWRNWQSAFFVQIVESSAFAAILRCLQCSHITLSEEVQVCGRCCRPRLVLVILTIPAADSTWDIKKDVKEPATSGKTAFCICMGNKDLEPFFPFVMIAAQTIST